MPREKRDETKKKKKKNHFRSCLFCSAFFFFSLSFFSLGARSFSKIASPLFNYPALGRHRHEPRSVGGGSRISKRNAFLSKEHRQTKAMMSLRSRSSSIGVVALAAVLLLLLLPSSSLAAPKPAAPVPNGRDKCDWQGPRKDCGECAVLICFFVRMFSFFVFGQEIKCFVSGSVQSISFFLLFSLSAPGRAFLALISMPRLSRCDIKRGLRRSSDANRERNRRKRSDERERERERERGIGIAKPSSSFFFLPSSSHVVR